MLYVFGKGPQALTVSWLPCTVCALVTGTHVNKVEAIPPVLRKSVPAAF